MKLQSKSFMLMLEEEITIGELKATLVAQIIGDKESFDIDFADVQDISYMGIKINGWDNWKKFKAFHKEMGIDFDAYLDEQFTKIFNKSAVERFVADIKF